LLKRRTQKAINRETQGLGISGVKAAQMRENRLAHVALSGCKSASRSIVPAEVRNLHKCLSLLPMGCCSPKTGQGPPLPMTGRNDPSARYHPIACMDHIVKIPLFNNRFSNAPLLLIGKNSVTVKFVWAK
jgi:hypothetical protein